MTRFFWSTVWTVSVCTFHFCILRPSKFSSMWSTHWFMFWSVIYTVLHAKDDNFKPSMGEQTRHLCYAKKIWSIKGMVGDAVGGLSESFDKRNIHEKCVEWSVDSVADSA